MKTNKKVKEYVEKYNDVPYDLDDRLLYIINKYNLSLKDIEKIKDFIIKNNNEMEELNFVFYFYPQATPRPRYSRFTKAFYIKNLMDYNAVFKQVVEACEDIDYIIDTPCEFYCNTYFQIPAKLNKVQRVLAELGFIRNISKPDWDNIGKTYSDMIQKYLLLDDALIYKGVVTKQYSTKPRIEIKIKYLKEHDSKYNKQKVDSWKRG